MENLKEIDLLLMAVPEDIHDNAWVQNAIKMLRDIAEIAKENEPVVIEEPNYHYEAMGCGLEDRGIQNRYEAMEHGWDCAIERFLTIT